MSKEEITKEILSILGNFKLSENIQIKELVALYMKKQEEIERLQKDLTYYQEYSADLLNKNNTFENIIKEVREDIEEVKERYDYYGNDNFDLSILSFWIEKLEILDKGE